MRAMTGPIPQQDDFNPSDRREVLTRWHLVLLAAGITAAEAAEIVGDLQVTEIERRAA